MTIEDVVRSLYPALADGDRSALDALLDAAFVGETTPGLPLELGGLYQGPAAMRRDFWGKIAKAYDVRADPAGYVVIDDQTVLVNGRYVGRARSTGRTFEASFVHTVTVVSGRITKLVQLTDSAAWVRALEDPGFRRCAGTEVAPEPLTTLVLSITHGLAHVHIMRPEAANSINAELARDLRSAALQISEEASVRAVLFTGEGPRFSGGGDIALFSRTPHAEFPALLDSMIADFHVALNTFAQLGVPVVCGVQGAVAGGGLGLLWSSDIIIAAPETKFAIGYGALGLTADGGSSWYLPRLVGPAVAAQMFLQNRILTGTEAHARGVVSELVPAEEVACRAEAVARQLASGPTRAFGVMRRLLRSTWDVDLAQQLDEEHGSIVQIAATQDAYEGVRAFSDRRTPDFFGA